MAYPSPFHRPNSPYFYFAYTDRHGKRLQRSTGEITKRRAAQEIERFIDDLRSDISDALFGDYADDFFIWPTCPHAARLIDQGKTIGQPYVERCRRLLEKHVFPIDWICTKPIGRIRRGDVLDLRRQLVTRLGQINTVNKVIGVVGVILAEATFREDIPANPAAGVGNINYERQERDAFTVEELRDLFAERPGHFSQGLAFDLFDAARLSGMRSGELRALRWHNVDGPVLRIREAFDARGMTKDPKWSSARDIWMPELLQEAIGRQRNTASGQYVFNRFGDPLGVTYWRKRYWNALVSFGLAEKDPKRDVWSAIGERQIPPHSLRHSVNTHIRLKGANPLLADYYFGWSPRTLSRVPQYYTHIKAEDTREVAELIDEVYG